MNRRNVKKWFFSLQIYLLISMAFWCSHADVYASVEHLSVQGTFFSQRKRREGCIKRCEFRLA